ncbi:hypothetical protein MIND_00079500 [Mycena indigotica]|uniref:4-coumarate-CoA ligase n=1 Tax=Mycena indigotica TaxID=2126181 RepID=A0A8H6TH38_9AGAR|nr:uncharacterized protein MIND_00079500 [Mycena indigotica]KAF7315640.1 hypothetical protein MIND_00079500 [Mycena indigotica]
MIYTSTQDAEPIPQLDFLTFLFDGPTSLAKDDNAVLHAEAANPDNCITKAQTRVLTRRVAHTLRNRFGIGQHGSGKDVVVVISTGQVMLPVLLMGIIAAGGVASLASASFRPEELARQIQHGDAKLCISCSASQNTLLEAARLIEVPLHRCLVLESTVPWRLRALTGSSHNNIVGEQELEWQRITSKEDLDNSLIFLLYSSGTTGPPKGVMMSHTNMVGQPVLASISLRKVWRTEGKYEYRTLAHLPPTHAAGVFAYFCFPFYNGGITFWTPKFDFADFLKYNKQLKITTIVTVPPIYLLLAKSPLVKDQFKTWRSAASGAAPLGKELQLEASKKLGVNISQTWGMTETSAVVTMVPHSVEERTGAAGILLPHLEIRIVDENDKDCPAETPGEILVRGPTVTKGYYKNPTANAETFKDGFLCTGDIGLFKNGQLYIVDRKKELIKYKGLQIAPAELEATLLSHPRILDAAVIGVHSAELETEVPRAYVVADPKGISADDIKALIKERLASYKQLRGGVVFVAEIPKSPSGKILRRELRAMATESAKAKL